MPTNLPYRLLPELARHGDAAALQGRLPLHQHQHGVMRLELPEGIAYDLKLANTGSGVLLSGSADALAITECMRCLEPARLELQAEVLAYYLLDPADADIAYEDDTAILVGPDGLVDLVEPLLAALAAELPFVALCQEDCKGLCPKCYANLNTEECTCLDEPDPDHPLAALRNLRID